MAPIQIKAGHKEEFIRAMLEDAQGSVNNGPGSLRFDVVQDAADPNRIQLCEVYQDEAAFQAHLLAPHLDVRRIAPGLSALRTWDTYSDTGALPPPAGIWPGLKGSRTTDGTGWHAMLGTPKEHI